MPNFDIVSDDVAYGVNLKVVPAKTDEYGLPNGYKYRLTIQAANRDHATNAVRFAISQMLKASTFER